LRGAAGQVNIDVYQILDCAPTKIFILELFFYYFFLGYPSHYNPNENHAFHMISFYAIGYTTTQMKAMPS
jgi:hypothetical protein